MSGYFFKSFLVVNTGFGMYGFSRGFRAQSKYETEPKLLSYKLLHGLASSILYMVPPWNVYYATKLINRIEINKRKLDITNYDEEFEELGGTCKDTF